MNSFVGIDKNAINSDNIDKYQLAVLYSKLFCKDDFIDECINNLKDKRNSTYELPKHELICDKLAIRIYGDFNLDIMFPEDYYKIKINDEPVYHHITEWGGRDIRKIKQYKLRNLLYSLFKKSKDFVVYCMYNVMQRGTDEQIVPCITFSNIVLLSDNNYMSLHDDDDLPEDAKHDTVIKCTDGDLTAHKLILTITSPLFANVIKCNNTVPIEIKFPFNFNTTETMLHILHKQEISGGIDMDVINALDYVQAIDKSKIMEHLIASITL